MLNSSKQQKMEKKIEITITSLILLRQIDDSYAKKKKKPYNTKNCSRK